MGNRIQVFAWRPVGGGSGRYYDQQIYSGNWIVAALLVALGARVQGDKCVTIKWRGK